MKEFMEQAMAMVQAQAGVRPMTPEEMLAEVAEIAKGLAALADGSTETKTEVQEPVIDPKKAIKMNSVICVECGAEFKILTKKHLALHGLTPAEYREKWGYGKRTPLVCKKLAKQRREKMAEMKIWEKVKTPGRKKKTASK